MRNMVVVISDLHFEEEGEDIVEAPGAGKDDDDRIEFRRNVPPKAFEEMMRDVAGDMRSNAVDRLDIVLGGDVFDLHRTQLWFKQEEGEDENLRPYVNCREVGSGSALEKKLLMILERIAGEPDVARSLRAFARAARGKYLTASEDESSEADFPATVTLHFIPGNHDRLVNATPALRKRVREILGLGGGDARFDHQKRFTDPPVLVRHGHEYDSSNFPVRFKRNEDIDECLPDELYDQPTFGDFVTVMIASRLPWCFRQRYGDDKISKDEVLRTIYCRILEFDDVRPQAAVLDFFLNTNIPAALRDEFPKRRDWQKHIWKLVAPVLLTIADDTVREEYFDGWMRKFRHGWLIAFLKLRPWRPLGLPFWSSRLVGYIMARSSGAGPGPQSYAAREKAANAGDAVFIVAGHTHQPQVAHLFTLNGIKRYFTDTGTWRNAVLAASDHRSYGRVNATTYVAFYGKDRDGGDSHERGFEHWTGHNQYWPVRGFDG